MNRRQFFGLLAAPLALDPERLLWTPGQRLISIPKPQPARAVWRRYIYAYDVIAERTTYRSDLVFTQEMPAHFEGVAIFLPPYGSVFPRDVLDTQRRHNNYLSDHVDLIARGGDEFHLAGTWGVDWEQTIK